MRRLKRLRKNAALRDLVAQANLKVSHLVMPYFVREGKQLKQPIQSMPGIFRFSGDRLLKDVEEAKRVGINSIILFGIPKNKDEKAVSAYQEDGVIQKAAAQLKKNFGDELVVITDVCLCEYTSHGHCGILESQKSKVKSQNGFFINTAIMSYSVKFNSSFYGPFREAAESGMKFGDRKSYQMDYRNSDEALREIEADIQEGADIVMVKPALSYLDIIARARERFNIPLAAFNVSGEYAMVKSYSLSQV